MIERDFYPLAELAERWGCKVHDLLHLGIQDRAQVCVNIYGMGMDGERIRTRMVTEVPEGPPEVVPQTDEEWREAEAHDAAFERWKGRTTRHMPHGLFELMHDDLRFLEMPGAFPYGLPEALKFDGGWWECEFHPPVEIGAAHLCMLREEVVRLDREVFARGGQASVDREFTTRESDSLLRILYGMACAKPYSFDPSAKRGEAAATIASATAAAGCSVDSDTVRRYLKLAAEKFGKPRLAARKPNSASR